MVCIKKKWMRCAVKSENCATECMNCRTHPQRCAVLSTEQFGLIFEFDGEHQHGRWTDHDWDFSRCWLLHWRAEPERETTPEMAECRDEMVRHMG